MELRTGIVIGCAALAVVAVVVVALIGVWIVHVSTDPEGLWMTAEAPDAVKVGGTFKLVVQATNRLSDQEIELGDLDIADDYLKGFTIVSVSPDPKSTEIDTFNNCTTTRFGVTLPPGESTEIQFELRADRVGRFRGQLDQYVGMQFVSAVVQTTVAR